MTVLRLVLIVVALVGGVLAALKWGPRAIDYGACVASHIEPQHRDAYLAPAVDMNGDLTLTVVDAEDWEMVVCDQWEFPHGRAEVGGVITFQLTMDEAAQVALGLSMVPKAAALLARLERQTAMEALLPWPVPPRLLIIERCDGADTMVEYYQDEQVDRILAGDYVCDAAAPAAQADTKETGVDQQRT